MMPEISLNILDVTQNSISAGASLIEIIVEVDHSKDNLTVVISDNGCGMSKETLKKVTDPFYTTRSTRNVGLGIPFFQYAAQSCGGHFDIWSEEGIGTKITAVFQLSHIDRMPLGDMTESIHALITFNNKVNFIYTFRVDNNSYTLDTRTFREILGDIPFDVPEVSSYIKEYLKENQTLVDGGNYI